MAFTVFFQAVAFLAFALGYLRVHSIQKKPFLVAAGYANALAGAGKALLEAFTIVFKTSCFKTSTSAYLSSC